MAIANRSCNQAVRPITATLGERGWSVGGCNLAELAKEFGTPLYVLDEATVMAACLAFRTGIAAAYPGTWDVLYASKALCMAAVARLVHNQGLATEVVSSGELHTALLAGIPSDRIYFQGNAKTRAELDLGLEIGVGRFMVDNLDELARLENAASSRNQVAEILLRVAPGIAAHTHEFIHTGQADSKFGLYLPDDLDAALARIKVSNSLRYLGLQAHVGSQIFASEPFLAAVDLTLDLALGIHRHRGLDTVEIDVGGGFGIAYTEAEAPLAIDDMMRAIGNAVVMGCNARGLTLPRLLVEPGRAIVGTAGCTVYRVEAVKRHQQGRRYLVVDGGMADNPRPITYGATYSCDAVIPTGLGRPESWSVAGKACEEGDVLVSAAQLPALECGHHLVVWTTGAYTFSMASNYNRLPKAAMVLVRDGQAELIRARESDADLLALDKLPERIFK